MWQTYIQRRTNGENIKLHIAYVGGKYRAKTEWELVQNIRTAEEIAAQLWEMGFAVICPHKNTSNFGGIYDIEDDVWLKGDLEILKRCDLLVVAPNWRDSMGTQEEIKFAISNNIPIYYWGNGNNTKKLKEFNKVEK
jgi:nucleoside 2-deoxyribosyltransferase